MPIYLTRKEYVTAVYEYEMELTDKLIAEYNEYVNKYFIFKDVEKVELTANDIKQAWERYYEDDSILNTPVIGRRHDDGSTYTYPRECELGDELQGLLSDDMWSVDSDEVDYTTDEVEDFVSEYNY